MQCLYDDNKNKINIMNNYDSDEEYLSKEDPLGEIEIHYKNIHRVGSIIWKLMSNELKMGCK